jgi:hypothetical protein
MSTPVGTLRIFVLDVHDLDVAERFWSAVTGLPVRCAGLDGRYTRLGADTPGSILLQLAPEAKDERKTGPERRPIASFRCGRGL